MDDVDVFACDEAGEVFGETGVKLLVLEVVAHIRNRRRRCAEFHDAKLIVGGVAYASSGTRTRLHDQDVVSPGSQSARELVGAPSASAADRRKGVSCEQHPHSMRIRWPGRDAVCPGPQGASDCRLQRAAVYRPAVIPDGAFTRSASEAFTEHPIGERLERVRQAG